MRNLFSTCSGNSGFGLHARGAMLLALATSLTAGCATKGREHIPPPTGSGIVEYKQIVAQSSTSVQAVLRSLEKVSAQTNRCPRKIVDGFSREVEGLQVASIQVRARAQAIQARGDAYFNDWQGTLGRVKDPRVRELAERFHPELEQAFSNIKLASQQTHAAFKPFLANLRKLRSELEVDPGVTQTGAARDLIRTTREGGGQVLQHLAAIQTELQRMTEMLTPHERATSP